MDGAELAEAQLGYAVSPKGDNLTGDDPGDWRPEWLVVGRDDEVGDPIFVDTRSDDWPVYTAAHGEGSWEAERIADSFIGFLQALRIVSELAVGRETPAALERNPLPQRQRARALAEIGERNPSTDLAYWEGWLEQE